MRKEQFDLQLREHRVSKAESRKQKRNQIKGIEENIRRSLIVNVDWDRDTFDTGFEASERRLLVRDNEWNIGGCDRWRDEEQSQEEMDQRSLNRIRHEIVRIRAREMIGGEERRRRKESLRRSRRIN